MPLEIGPDLRLAPRIGLPGLRDGHEAFRTGRRATPHAGREQGHEVLCLPFSPRAAPLKNTPTDDLEVRFRHQAMCLLCISGLGGLPQASLPLATLDGFPLGLSLIARRGADSMLLSLTGELVA